MSSKLTAPLRQAPVTVPAALALVLFFVWATSEAGYPVTHWAPGGLVMLALLAIGTVINYLDRTVLGIAAALVGESLGAWLQNPWVLGAFAVLLTALALTLIAGRDLALPQAWQDRMSRA